LKSYGDYLLIDKPTWWQFRFFFMVEYQFGYMYWRYLMWNFVGDKWCCKERYDYLDGNWLSGISFIDELHLGSQDNLPSDVVNNKVEMYISFLPLF
jgi:hypothetical protein